MAIRVALYHETSYRYDRWVTLAPQLIRLRPAPHSRTPILSYSLNVSPGNHFQNWQQDPQGNFVCRFVFPEKTDHFRVQVDLVAELTVINPFDFFVESWAEQIPFEYPELLRSELAPYLVCEPAGPLFAEYLAGIDRSPKHVVNFLVDLNRDLQQHIGYLIRLEPGIQSPEETLMKRSGSCRDSAWLLVQLLRHLGLAARFVSGYLIQLTPDVKALDGPSGAEHDFTDLHAWTEVFIPGAGWIGLDPTSGLFAGEGHIPLAGTPDPVSAAPITGGVDPCEAQFHFEMQVTRIHEDPRVTKPYSEAEWERVQQVGRQVDEILARHDVRLTMGGEPTFVSIDDMDGPEWTVAAVGPMKRRLSEELVRRLRGAMAPRALLHFGQGKWYPGEPLPRWALSCLWRTDGEPLWLDDRWIADTSRDYGHTPEHARRFLERLAERLEVGTRWITAAYEDPWYYLAQERRLPVNVEPGDPKLKNPEERARMARVVELGLDRVVGFVLPLKRQWWQGRASGDAPWRSGPWPVRPERMFLLPGDSPLGLRLPLDSLPHVPPSQVQGPTEFDPLAPREPLPPRPGRLAQPEIPAAGAALEPERRVSEQSIHDNLDASHVIRTALCVEAREGRLYVFMPPVERLEDYLDLLAAVEDTAASLEFPIVVEGYLPPHDPRLEVLKVTPDPGVIEVNVQPARSWDELVHITETLYEQARLSRLGTEKFDLDGRHTGTGGGNHVVLGGAAPADSPFLRRPDLLRSLIAFWNNHPSLSYLFSGTFVGPTSQAPRVDEGRADALYELEIAFRQVPDPAEGEGGTIPPWLVDRLFRNLLVDLTGNTHRAEFCIDKLYSPDGANGRLGLVEFRAFEMPPHPRMSLAQQLLLRALVGHFWEKPYRSPLVRWGTSLHDRFMLPHFVREDFRHVLEHLELGGIRLEESWYAAHFEFRFPFIGSFSQRGVEVELRQAIEPWYVLGEEAAAGGTTRFVDSSVERLQVLVRGMVDSRHVIACNGRKAPLHPTGVPGEFVAGVRYRAWQPPSCLHPTIPVHSPLVFDLLDTSLRRSLGGCVYHVAHPGGRNYTTFPVNAYEAESRRGARFSRQAHTPGRVEPPRDEHNREYPFTLDLRRG